MVRVDGLAFGVHPVVHLVELIPGLIEDLLQLVDLVGIQFEAIAHVRHDVLASFLGIGPSCRCLEPATTETL